MTHDFTYDAYADLLDACLAAEYEFITVRDYLSWPELPERFVVLRHDVDRKPENAAEMARVEADRHIPSTYYFRTIDKTFKPSVIREIDTLGHEIGYHYEDMDRADGDVEGAHDSFDEHLHRLRQVATVDTVCMHGNPLTAHDNRDMWTAGPDFAAYDLLGEAYLSMDFEDVTYFSDTGRTWRDGALKIKDHTMGEGDKTVQADTTWDLVALLSERRVRRACLLSHPNRWAGSYRELIAEQAKDSAVNAVKYGMQLIP